MSGPCTASGDPVFVGAVFFGHSHVERDLFSDTLGAHGRIIVLPEWKGSRRHLRVSADGWMELVASEP